MSKTRADSAKRLVAKYQSVFGSKDGRDVLRNLITVNHILSPTYEGDVNQTLIREGQRNAILRILTILKMDPEQMLRTIEEEESHV